MSRLPCPQANEGCKYWNGELGCFSDPHHLYYPRPEYTTHLEKQFRNLGCNIIQLCRAEHDERHHQPAPDKPSGRFMQHVIAGFVSGRMDYEPAEQLIIEGLRNGYARES